MKTKAAPAPAALPPATLPTLEEVRLVLVTDPAERRRFRELVTEHHYLHNCRAVGEQLYYAAQDAQGRWLALLLFSAAANHLKHRDQFIGWTDPQRARRLSLIVNNTRFLILPGPQVANLASRVLRLILARLSEDWQARYRHPVLLVETFVDPGQFCGTLYTANGWTELGATDGYGRVGREYYTFHDHPKRLFVRALTKNACRTLQAEHLPPALRAVEKKAGFRCPLKVAEIQALTEHFQALPDYRTRIESYPTWSLVTLILLAMLCEAPRGQKDLAKFAQGLTQAQRRALGFRGQANRRFPAPSQSTFSRLLAGLDAAQLNRALLAIQTQVRGAPPPDELIVIDGKEPKHGSGVGILAAVTVPGQFYLGSALVGAKTNEIPVARELFGELDLRGRWAELDALHTQTETARQLVLDHGGHYLLTVKDNQPTLRATIDHLVPVPRTGFSPSAGNGNPGAHGGNEQGGAGKSHA